MECSLNYSKSLLRKQISNELFLYSFLIPSLEKKKKTCIFLIMWIKLPQEYILPPFIEIYINHHVQLYQYSQSKHAPSGEPDPKQESIATRKNVLCFFPVTILPAMGNNALSSHIICILAFFGNVYPCPIYTLCVLLLSLNIMLRFTHVDSCNCGLISVVAT